MAVIERGRQLMTLVNIFTVKPDKQAELAELLVRATRFEPIVCEVVDSITTTKAT